MVCLIPNRDACELPCEVKDDLATLCICYKS